MHGQLYRYSDTKIFQSKSCKNLEDGREKKDVERQKKKKRTPGNETPRIELGGETKNFSAKDERP